MDKKTCVKCNEVFPATTEYFYKTNSKLGLSARCKNCADAAMRRYQQAYKERNREKIKEKKREYNKKHAERIKKYQQEYKEKNRQKLKKYQQEYREKKRIQGEDSYGYKFLLTENRKLREELTLIQNKQHFDIESMEAISKQLDIVNFFGVKWEDMLIEDNVSSKRKYISYNIDGNIVDKFNKLAVDLELSGKKSLLLEFALRLLLVRCGYLDVDLKEEEIC